MADKNISIKIKADSKDAEKGINKITSELNKLAKNKSVSSMGKLGQAFSLVKQVVSTVTSAIKSAAAVMNDLTDSYNRQASAETMLETAASNNPYLDGYAVSRLKEYASQMQKVSTYGDEQLLPMMAQLAASGRTQAEIQDIINASVNVAASGTMSLESAVKNLNKTYSGLSGELGEAMPQIKNLSKEQLKNGDAVKVVAESYKGMAERIASTTGAGQQLSNAWGDLKENAGSVISYFINPIKRGLASLITGINELWEKAREAAGAASSEPTTLESRLEKQKTDLAALEAQLESMTQKTSEAASAQKGYADEIAEANKKGAESSNYLEKTLRANQESNLKAAGLAAKGSESMSNAIDETVRKRDEETESLKSQIEAKKAEIEQTQKEIQANKTREQLEAEIKARNKLREEYDKAVNDKKKEIEIRRQAGEEISREEEAQELYNTALSAYIKMMTSPEFAGNSGSYEHEEKAREFIDEMRKLANIELPEFTLDTSASIEEQKRQLEDYKKILQSMLEDVDKDSEAYKTLTKAIKETDEAIKSLSASAKDWGDLTVWEKLEFAEKQLSSLASSIDSALSLTAETMDNEASAALSNLESQYAQGLVSEEDYYDKKDKIEQDSARKKYKIELATWAMNLAATQSAAALAIANSLKDGSTLGMIQAAVMGVQTAVQLAAQIAAKPVPPSFASGGVVGGFQGASTGGDNTYIHARNGEMMLNAAQQRNLFDVANSRMGGGVKWNITVNNEAGDVASASATASDDGIQIAVKKIVSEAMAGGELNDSYQAMRAGIYGRRITS